MNARDSFWLLDSQLLHQWGNDMVAARGYIELLQAEHLSPSANQIVSKLQAAGGAHHVHVELYRRALAIHRTPLGAGAGQRADMVVSLGAAEKALLAFVPAKFQVGRQKPLPALMIEQAMLNQIVAFVCLLLAQELEPKRGQIAIRFRRRSAYLSTALSVAPKREAERSSLLLPAVEFIKTVITNLNGSVELRHKDASVVMFLRLPVSKQLKLI